MLYGGHLQSSNQSSTSPLQSKVHTIFGLYRIEVVWDKPLLVFWIVPCHDSFSIHISHYHRLQIRASRDKISTRRPSKWPCNDLRLCVAWVLEPRMDWTIKNNLKPLSCYFETFRSLSTLRIRSYGPFKFRLPSCDFFIPYLLSSLFIPPLRLTNCFCLRSQSPLLCCVNLPVLFPCFTIYRIILVVHY